MNIDVVIIGINTERTLQACLESVLASKYTRGELKIFYVDGGSTDNSVEVAKKFDSVRVIETHPKHPSPGLDRNNGWRAGGAALVQFLDSDTILHPNWLDQAVDTMQEGIAAVRGNRTELHPEATAFNWIGNLEWNAPPGECDAFGGDVLVRRAALEQTNGYDEVLVGGEDPELSRRIRALGWKIIQLDAPMTSHDLAMRTVRQYWNRAFRTGYGFAAVTSKHGFKDGFWAHEMIRIFIRGGGGISTILFGCIAGILVHPSLFLVSAMGIGLVLFPRLLRISYFERDKKISRKEAKIYSWHCSLVVIPEFFGAARFVFGKLFNLPLHNKRPRASPRPPSAAVAAISLIAIAFLGILAGCNYSSYPNFEPGLYTAKEETFDDYDLKNSGLPKDEAEKKLKAMFKTETEEQREKFSTPEEVEAYSESLDDTYLMGAGDVLSLHVWGRPEISQARLVVAPDGELAVPRIGYVNVKEKTIKEATDLIKEGLGTFYESPEVVLNVQMYANNKAFVLGRVQNPGVVHFSGQGTLLEALALAGGLPILATDAFLTKCSVIRGKDLIVWIDLRELFAGDSSLNMRIRNNDIIYIPESEGELVYVIGEVMQPGALRLKSRLTLMDAIMSTGGPTQNADVSQVYVIRSESKQGVVRHVDLHNLLKRGDFTQNFLLQDNDVVYVGQTGISKYNFLLENLMPSLQFMRATTDVPETWGVMQKIRKELWGQEGFVGN